jgi:hypothetical protein
MPAGYLTTDLLTGIAAGNGSRLAVEDRYHYIIERVCISFPVAQG